MRLENHRIAGIQFRAAHYTGGTITPTIVILHDTAGRLEKGNSAAYLASANPGKVSVHFVIERDGTIEQQVLTNRRANHAGQSSYHGRNSCNEFSIGIELVNPGKMAPVQGVDELGFYARAWWGQNFADDADCELSSIKTREHGEGVWMDYTPWQIASLLDLLESLFDGIPTLKDITTHWYVSPGRKVDTNPLLPLDHIRARILGRDDPADLAAEAGSDPVPTATMLRVVTNGASLNMRGWPSFNPNVIGSIPNGTLVPAIRSGVFDGRAWTLVQFDSREGWIVDAYTQPA